MFRGKSDNYFFSFQNTIVFYINRPNNFYLQMHMLFTTEREREMMQLKKKKFNHILLYNQQQIQRKREQKLSQNQQKQHSYRMVNLQTLEVLSQENNKKSKKKEIERNLLRESYDKQIRQKEERIKMERIKDKEFYNRQKAYSDFAELRRMADIQKMFDQQTFIATPLKSHKRARTQPFQQQKQLYNPEPSPFHLPSIKQKRYEIMNHNRLQQAKKSEINNSAEQKHLDNICIQTFSKPKSFVAKKQA